MRVKNNYIILLLCIYQAINAVTIGSDSAVSRLSAQQTLNNGDRVAGFVALQGGCFISTPTSNAQWDCFFPISGNIDLGAGTLTLTRDFVCSDVATLSRMGNVVGNGYAVDFCPSMTQIPTLIASTARCTVSQIVQQTYSAAVNSVDWAFDSQLLAIGLNGTTNNLIIARFNGTTITNLSTNTVAAAAVNTVRWSPTGYFLAVGTATGATNQLFTYSVNSSTGALTSQSSVAVSGGVNSIAWRPQANFLEVSSTAGSFFNSYPISSTAVLGTPVTQSLTQSSDVLRWDATGLNLAVGTVVSGGNPQLLVYTFNAGTNAFTLNASNVWGSQVSGVSFNPVYSNLLAICSVTGTTRLAIFNYNAGAGSLTQISSATEANNPAAVVAWNPLGTCVVLGKQHNAANPELSVYYFDQTVQALFATPVNITTGVSINDVQWAPSGVYFATGDSGDHVTVYELIDGLAMGTCLNWSNVYVELDTNVALNNTCILFTGVCTLDGQYNVLSLSPSTTLQIGVNSSLLIKNITFNGPNAHNIQCTDFTSSITFSNVNLILSNNLNFSTGKFDVYDELLVSGSGHSFLYTTSAISRILPYSTFALDVGVTFSYAPLVSSNQFFKLLDKTSTLALNSATLYASLAGLQLTTGVLQCGGNSALITQGTLSSQAIWFGDGVSSANDLLVHILPGAVVDVIGIVVDANV